MKHMRTISTIFVLLGLLAISVLMATPARAAGIRYAKPSGTGNCSTWANACDLQTALTSAINGDEVWVAAGTYKPTTGTNRSTTFQLKIGVAVYGSFAGTETARSQRNPAVNVTILSGDLLGNDNSNVKCDEPTRSDNSYHVVTGATGATLDGFTITGGNANGTFPYSGGGGLYNNSSSPTLMNIIFTTNSANGGGGGIYNSFSNPLLLNVTFTKNSAGNWGGGMYDGASNPTLTNVTFRDNSARYGGGIGNEIGDPKNQRTVLTNVTFSGNLAEEGGGGIASSGGILILNNVTFSNNSALYFGGGMYDEWTSVTITNTIFWGNAAPEYPQFYHSNEIGLGFPDAIIYDSVVQGDCPENTTCANIIDADPKLGVIGNYGGFTQTIPLLPGSSAIDAGDDSTCADTDQRGVERPIGTSCDIGAFEASSLVTLLFPIDGAKLPTNPPTLIWTALPGAANYQIQIALDPAFTKPLNKTLKATVTSYIPTKNLLSDTLYYWHVRAKMGKTYGPWSETWSFTTGNPPPIPKLSAPGNKKTVTGSPTFIWKAVKPVTGVTFGHYEIQIATNAAFTVNLQSASTGTAIQYNGFILTPGIYYWRVRSVADNGDYSAWSAARMVTIQ
jgi:predicted outer membrane repeat protein